MLRQHLLNTRPVGDVERMQTLASSARYQAGNLEAEAEYYRIHFGAALRQPERLEQVIGRLRAHFDAERVLKARAIEERLYEETWRSDAYDLLPELKALDIPTLVLHGEHDLIPVVLAAHIAQAMPRGRLVALEECAHFAYLESPDAFCEHVAALLESS